MWCGKAQQECQCNHSALPRPAAGLATKMAMTQRVACPISPADRYSMRALLHAGILEGEEPGAASEILLPISANGFESVEAASQSDAEQVSTLQICSHVSQSACALRAVIWSWCPGELAGVLVSRRARELICAAHGKSVVRADQFAVRAIWPHMVLY